MLIKTISLTHHHQLLQRNSVYHLLRFLNTHRNPFAFPNNDIHFDDKLVLSRGKSQSFVDILFTKMIIIAAVIVKIIAIAVMKCVWFHSNDLLCFCFALILIKMLMQICNKPWNRLISYVRCVQWAENYQAHSCEKERCTI